MKNVFWKLLLSKKHLYRFSKVLKIVRKIAKEAIKVRVIDVRITRVSNYRKFKWDIHVIAHQLRDRCTENQSQN